MIAKIYEHVGDFSRSIVRARLVAEIEIEEFPEDQGEFASEHGGDFFEIVLEESER